MQNEKIQKEIQMKVNLKLKYVKSALLASPNGIVKIMTVLNRFPQTLFLSAIGQSNRLKINNNKIK